MDKSIICVGKEQCTGCGACYNKCPVNAIVMEYDEEGFLFPRITENCVHCGLCESVCPALHPLKLHPTPSAYAVWANDEIRLKSSSGGMFTLLANYVLDQGGVVCGAAYSEDYLTVNHIVVTSKDELFALNGSKYLQSSIGKTYSEAKNYLDAGLWVLYTGTPCQIAGFQNFLKKDYEKLILVDIVCHGTPSPKAYQKYIEELARDKKILKMDFREKSFWHWGTATSLFLDDGSVYRENCYKDPYWRSFLGGLSTRLSCGTCKYACINRVGDFTLGDFWGVGQLDASCDDGGGTSLVLVNSQKAQKLLCLIKPQCNLLKKFDLNSVLELSKTRNGQMLHPTPSQWAHKRFFALLDVKPFSVAYDYATNAKYDVGIVGWWYNLNYGGTLTYFALNNVISKMGQSVLMINQCTDDPNYTPAFNSIPYRFAMKHYNISKVYSPKTIECLSDHCNAFVSGSDQLFNPTLWRWSGPQYFLNFAKSNNKIISYASSFGNSFYDPNNLKVLMGYWLRRFDALSVRETYAVDICRNIFGLDAKKVMDPVFLCDVQEYEKLAEESGLRKNKPYLLSFILDPNESKKNAITSLSSALNLDYINLINADNIQKNQEKLGLENTKADADVEEWLFYYKNADFVITDSFHGTCFAIIFRKKFISIANYQRGANRFISLLEEVGLQDRLVKDISEIATRPELLEEIDYDKVYQIINPKVQDSLQWLKNAIFAPKEMDASLFNTLSYQFELLAEEYTGLKESHEKLKKEFRAYMEGMNSPDNQVVPTKKSYRERFNQCCKDHGFLYTLRRAFTKLRKYFQMKA